MITKLKGGQFLPLQWLNDIAIRQNINFSQVLQEALMQKVNAK